MVTSQNLTRGNRFESAVVSTSRDVFDSLYDAFDFIVNNLSVPLSELMQIASDYEFDKGDAGAD